MKILVAGKSGQVATALARAGTSSNHEVVCLGRPDLDVSVIETVRGAIELHRPDLVINASAYTAVDAAETEQELAFLVNETGPSNLARITSEYKTPIFHISTDYVFDGAQPMSYAETHNVSPLGVYGTSKLAGERAIIEENQEHFIFRTAWVYSPFGKNFVKTMLRLAETRDEISVVDDQIGSPTSALDIADSLLAIATQIEVQNPTCENGIFHLAGSGIASWADLADAVIVRYNERLARNVKIVRIESKDFPTPTKRPVNSRLDSSKVQRVFGIRLPEWRQSVRTCVDEILNGGRGKF